MVALLSNLRQLPDSMNLGVNYSKFIELFSPAIVLKRLAVVIICRLSATVIYLFIYLMLKDKLAVQ